MHEVQCIESSMRVIRLVRLKTKLILISARAVVFSLSLFKFSTCTDRWQYVLPTISSKETFLSIQNKVRFGLRILLKHFLQLDGMELRGTDLPTEGERCLAIIALVGLFYVGRHIYDYSYVTAALQDDKISRVICYVLNTAV